jgi:ABC-type branched-subunit amino acid transport system substrate-binding protein
VTRKPFEPYLINLRVSLRDEAAAMIKYLVTKLLVDRIAVIFKNDTMGWTSLDGIKNALAPLNLKLVASASFEPNAVEADVVASVDKVFQARPKALVIVALNSQFASIVKLYRRKRDFDPQTHFVGTSSLVANTLVTQLGGRMTNIFMTQVVPPPSGTEQQITKAFRNALAKFDPNMTPDFTSLEGYLNARLTIEVLARIQGNLSRERFQEIVYESSIFRLEDLWVGPYSQKVSPGQEAPESEGCSQGGSSTFLVAYNSSTNDFYLITEPVSFFPYCAANVNDIPVPAVFAHIHEGLVPGGDNFLRGLRAAFEGEQVTGDFLKMIEVIKPRDMDFDTMIRGIPWYSQLIGYIGNEGDANEPSFMSQEMSAGKIFFGLQSGEMRFRKPFNLLIMNLRASMTDEVYATAYHILHTRDNSRVALIADSAYPDSEVLDVLRNELNVNGITLQSFVRLSDSSDPATDIKQLFETSSVDVVVIVAETDVAAPVVELLVEKDVHLFFTSLSPLPDILEMVGDKISNVTFCSGIPHTWKDNFWPIVDVYERDVTALFANDSNLDFILEDALTFEGYVLGSTVLTMASKLAGSISGSAFSDFLTSNRNIDLGGLVIGPFSSTPCGAGNVTLSYHCECSQGLQAVNFYTIEPETHRAVYDTKHSFDKCGAELSNGTFPFLICWYTSPIPFPAEKFWPSYQDESNVDILFLNGVGGLFCVSVLLVVVFLYKHPVIVRSNVLYLVPILFGIALGHASVLAFLGEPTPAKCSAQGWLPGMSWVLVVG